LTPQSTLVPAVIFAAGWRRFKATAFGLPQSTLLGSISVTAPSGAQLAHLEALFTEFFLHDSLPASSPDLNIVGRFANLILFSLGAIQRQHGVAVSNKFIVLDRKPNGDKTEFKVAIPCVDIRATEYARQWVLDSLRLLQSPAHETDLQLTLLDGKVDEYQEKFKLYKEAGINNYNILLAAYRLGIPVRKLQRRLILLGIGKHARMLDSTVTDRTNPLGVQLARDKWRSAQTLIRSGLPGATQLKVSSRDEAVSAAQKLGYPVVVKPADKDRGAGVFANLRDARMVSNAFNEAASISNNILVEKWVPGFTHRLTVFNGKLVRVTKRIAGGVVGDGFNNVESLVAAWVQDRENRRRARRLGKPLMALDEEALELLSLDGKDKHYTPTEGEYVRLRRRDNINSGGTNEHYEPDEIHPDNQRLAIDIAAIFRLDFAGIDLIITDIRESWLQIGGLVCEVNAQPQVGGGTTHDIYDEVLNSMVESKGKIPCHLVVCPANPETKKSILDGLMSETEGKGIADQSGLWVNGSQVSAGFQCALDAIYALFLRPDVISSVCIVTADELLQTGLPIPEVDKVSVYRSVLSAAELNKMAELEFLLNGLAIDYL